jgi:quercetin dioxygenase-like cupin family protein
MASAVCAVQAAGIVDRRDLETVEVMGPTLEYLSRPAADDAIPCVMRGTIPPGVDVPLHSHGDPETFIQLSGEVEGFSQPAEGSRWIRIRPGDVFHVPGGAPHAFRNRSGEPAVSVIITTSKLGRFFREVGTPTVAGATQTSPPSEATIRHFLEMSERYGYWNATPEENARIGLTLPAAA